MIINEFILGTLYKINLMMEIISVTWLTIWRILMLQGIVSWQKQKVGVHSQVRAIDNSQVLVSDHYAEISHTVQSPNTVTDGKWILHYLSPIMHYFNMYINMYICACINMWFQGAWNKD